MNDKSFEVELREILDEATKRAEALMRKYVYTNVISKLNLGYVAHAPSESTETPRYDKKGKRITPKRPLEVLTDTANKILSALEEFQTGIRVEPLGLHLGMPTKDLALPIRKLLKEKKIKSLGWKRNRRYFPIHAVISNSAMSPNGIS